MEDHHATESLTIAVLDIQGVLHFWDGVVSRTSTTFLEMLQRVEVDGDRGLAPGERRFPIHSRPP